LINPFYPKDPHTSFAKHVLTPSVALTSVAAATPPEWTVRYWDENLLQGRPPAEPVPQVVGITVHLTFARRAFELADWYRRRGAVVVLGGMHVTACPDECASHADAIAVGNGVVLWPRILRDVEAGTLEKVYRADYTSPFAEEPTPRRDILDRESYLTTTSLIATRGLSTWQRYEYDTPSLEAAARYDQPSRLNSVFASVFTSLIRMTCIFAEPATARSQPS